MVLSWRQGANEQHAPFEDPKGQTLLIYRSSLEVADRQRFHRIRIVDLHPERCRAAGLKQQRESMPFLTECILRDSPVLVALEQIDGSEGGGLSVGSGLEVNQ